MVNISSEKTRKKLRKLAKENSSVIFRKQEKFILVNLMFSIFEYLDLFIFITPVLFYYNQDRNEGILDLFVLNDLNFRLNYDFKLNQTTNNISVVFSCFKNENISFRENQSDFNLNEAYAFLTPEESKKMEKDEKIINCQIDFENVSKNLFELKNPAILFQFNKKQIKSASSSFLEKLNCLEFLTYEVYRWLFKIYRISCFELLFLDNKLEKRFKCVNSVAILMKVLKIEVKTLFNSKKFRIDSNFLFDFLSAMVYWTFYDKEQIMRIILPSFLFLFFEGYFNLSRKNPFKVLSKLKNLLQRAASCRKTLIKGVEHEFNVKFETDFLENFTNKSKEKKELGNIFKSIKPKIIKSLVFSNYLESFFKQKTENRSILTPNLSFLFDFSNKKSVQMKNLHSKFSSLIFWDEFSEKNLNLLYFFSILSTENAEIIYKQLDFQKKIVELLLDFDILISNISKESQKSEFKINDCEFLHRVLFSYITYFSKILSLSINYSRIINYLSTELLMIEKNRLKITKLEEIFTNNYKNGNFSEIAIKNSQNDKEGILSHRTLYPEFRENNLDDLCKYLEINKRLIIYLSAKTNRNKNHLIEETTSFENFNKLRTNKSIRIGERGALNQDSLTHIKNGSNKGLSLINDNLETNSKELFESKEISLNLTFYPNENLEKKTENQEIHTFGFNNFSQLGFPKDMWVKKNP